MILEARARAELAPTGTLRAGVNLGNPALVRRQDGTGAVIGLAPALARSLAAEAGVELELVVSASAAQMAAGAGASWDVAFLAVDPERERDLVFSDPYLLLEGAYLVSEESGIDSAADVDQEGVRIGVSERSAYDLHLARSLRHATRVTAPSPDAAFALILDGTVDVVAGVRQHLEARTGRIAAGRVLDGRFMSIPQAVAVPRGHAAAAAFVQAFVARAKASGQIARAIAGAGLDGVEIAP